MYSLIHNSLHVLRRALCSIANSISDKNINASVLAVVASVCFLASASPPFLAGTTKLHSFWLYAGVIQYFMVFIFANTYRFGLAGLFSVHVCVSHCHQMEHSQRTAQRFFFILNSEFETHVARNELSEYLKWIMLLIV